MVFEERGKKLSEPGAKKRISNKINPRIAVMGSPSSGFDPGSHWWETDSLTAVLLLFPAFVYYFYMNRVGIYHLKQLSERFGAGKRKEH